VFLDYRNGGKAPIPEPVLRAFDEMEGWEPNRRPGIE